MSHLITLKTSCFGSSPEIFIKSVWVSSGLALIFTLPPLAVMFAIYCITNNLLAGVVVGFTLHFLILATSPKISDWLSWFIDD